MSCEEETSWHHRRSRASFLESSDSIASHLTLSARRLKVATHTGIAVGHKFLAHYMFLLRVRSMASTQTVGATVNPIPERDREGSRSGCSVVQGCVLRPYLLEQVRSRRRR